MKNSSVKDEFAKNFYCWIQNNCLSSLNFWGIKMTKLMQKVEGSGGIINSEILALRLSLLASMFDNALS